MVGSVDDPCACTEHQRTLYLWRASCQRHGRGQEPVFLMENALVAPHLPVVKLTCNEHGDPDILLLARFHA
jgi:hypothetical protein